MPCDWLLLSKTVFLKPRFVGLQESANPRAPGLVNFVAALAYHFCMALPAAFTQPGDRLLAEPCKYRNGK